VNPFCSGFCESNIFDFSLSFIIFSIIFEYVGVMGISKQSILLLQNLYQNAKSYIKWNGQISEEFFIIEQGPHQKQIFHPALLCKLVILNLCFLFQILQ
jgi:hypothetical protein